MSTPPSTSTEAGSDATEVNTPMEINIPEVVFIHGMTLRELIVEWHRIRQTGIPACKGILGMRLYELFPRDYPKELPQLVESLVKAMDNLDHLVNCMDVVSKQLDAVTLIHSSSERILGSWTVARIADAAKDIVFHYQLECGLKRYVTDNIVQRVDEDIHVSLDKAWELDLYLKPTLERLLFIDIGVIEPF